MKLIVLDRDGVINEDSDNYIKTPEEWVPIEGSLEAIARLHHAGYRIVVATNQSGLGRGLFTLDTLVAIHKKMHTMVQEAGGALDGIFFCPHTPEDDCNCRKPKAGLMHDIERRLGTSLKGIPVVGDSLRDLESAWAVGAEPVLVRTGKGERTLKDHRDRLEGVPIDDCLYAYVDRLLSQHATG
ncbi:MAG: D-glycero-beta-D-manno-heptose 1,7-bisphosphate 7-phosphatase [Gammaproteobacteria bacterium]